MFSPLIDTIIQPPRLVALSVFRAIARVQPALDPSWLPQPKPAQPDAVKRCGTTLATQLDFEINLPPARRPRPKARRARRVRRAPPYPLTAYATRAVMRSSVLRPSKHSVTPLMAELERILIRIAESGNEIPNNPILGQRCGGRGRSSIDRALRKLAKAGRIIIENEGSRRRIYVASLDQYTDWGEARPGHAPYCRRGKPQPGEQPFRPPPPPIHAGETLPRLPSLMGMTWERQPVAVGASRTCQFPLWEDFTPNTGMFCGQPVMQAAAGDAQRSFCAHHHAVVYLPKRRRRSQDA